MAVHRAQIAKHDLHARLHAHLRAYYDETWLDYRWLWLNQRNLAIHFGYWDAQTRSHAEALINMNRVLAHAAGITPGMRILDAGCGVGRSATWLAQTCAVQVVGITPVPTQVDRARHAAARQGVADRVTFDQQDYTSTTYLDGSFDVVWALESVCHAVDKQAFAQEARRLLRPGGRLVIADYIRTERPHTPQGERLLQSWLSGWAIPDVATGDELVAWTRAAGFQDVQLRDVTWHVQPSLRRLYRIAAPLYPGESLLYALGVRSRAQHGNARGARDQYRALRRGLWFYGMLRAKVPLGRSR